MCGSEGDGARRSRVRVVENDPMGQSVFSDVQEGSQPGKKLL